MANMAERFAFMMDNGGHAVDIREAFAVAALSHFRSVVAYDKPADHDENGMPVSLSLTTIDKASNGKPRSFSAAINSELYAVMEDRLRGNCMEYVDGGNTSTPKGNQQLLPAFEEVNAEKKIALYAFSAENENGEFDTVDKDGNPIFVNYVFAFVGKFDIMSDDDFKAYCAKVESVKNRISSKQTKPTAKTVGDAPSENEIF